MSGKEGGFGGEVELLSMSLHKFRELIDADDYAFLAACVSVAGTIIKEADLSEEEKTPLALAMSSAMLSYAGFDARKVVGSLPPESIDAVRLALNKYSPGKG